MGHRNLEVQLFDVNGRMWELNNPRSAVRVVKGGWPELSAKMAATMRDGEPVKGRSRPVPGAATMTVGFYPGHYDLGEKRRLFRAGWANDEYCTAQVRRPGGVWHQARVRLPDDAALPGREVATPDIFDTLAVPLAWDDGVWWVRVVDEGTTVVVRNDGLTPVVPSVRWDAGGRLGFPSGMSVTLPTVAGGRVLSLNRRRGFPVTDRDGVPDRDMQRRLWGKIVEEKIMPGETGRFTLPPGATLVWDMGVSEP